MKFEIFKKTEKKVHGGNGDGFNKSKTPHRENNKPETEILKDILDSKIKNIENTSFNETTYMSADDAKSEMKRILIEKYVNDVFSKQLEEKDNDPFELLEKRKSLLEELKKEYNL